MGIYKNYILPRLLNVLLSTKYVTKLRRIFLQEVSGNILEIGFGTGLNLPHYTEKVTHLTIIEPNPGMYSLAKSRIKNSSIPFESHLLAGEKLPFKDKTFDAIVMTFTLCSIAGAHDALNEMLRVLKDDGKLYFLEHGLSNESPIQHWQNFFNPMEKFLFDGCHLNRKIDLLIEEAGFKIKELKTFYLEKEPKICGYLYQGVAQK